MSFPLTHFHINGDKMIENDNERIFIDKFVEKYSEYHTTSYQISKTSRDHRVLSLFVWKTKKKTKKMFRKF